MSLLTERVLKNEEARHGNANRRRYRARFFEDQIGRHALDYKFNCGLDPQGVSIKEYTAHIRACPKKECQGRWERWPLLLKQLGVR
jgi:hypothetical protein